MDSILLEKQKVIADSLFSLAKYEKSERTYDGIISHLKKQQDWDQVVEIYNKISGKNIDANRLNVAKRYNEMALDVASESFGECNIPGEVFENLGIIKYYEQEFEMSFKYYRKALSIYEKEHETTPAKLHVSYEYLGDLYSGVEKYDSAVFFYIKSLAIILREMPDNISLISSFYNKIGISLNVKGANLKALEWFDKNLRLFLNQPNKDWPQIATTYYLIGGVYKDLRNYSTALLYFNKALQIYQDSAKDDLHPRSLYLYHIGSTYEMMEDFTQALKYYTESFSLRLTMYGENDWAIADDLLTMATIHTKMDNYDLAIQNLEKSLGILNQSEHKLQALFMEVHIALGSAYQGKREYKRAMIHHKEAFKFGQRINCNCGPNIVKAYNVFGDNYRLMNNYDSALLQYEKAIKGNREHLYISKDENDSTAKKYFDKNDLLVSISGKSKSLMGRYLKYGNNEDLILALNIALEGDTLIDEISSNIQSDEDKIIFNQHAKVVSKVGAYSSFRMFEKTQIRKYRDLAFYFTEKSKSSVLKAAISKSRAHDFVEINEDLIKEEYDLNINIAYHQSKLKKLFSRDGSHDKHKVRKFQEKLFQLSLAKDSLKDFLEINHPQYFKLKHSSKVMSASEVQQSIDSKSALIEYLVGDSTLHIFTITSENFFIDEIRIDSTLLHRIKGFRNYMTPENIINVSKYDPSHMQSAYDLFNLLLTAPLSHLGMHIKKLIIIPHEELSYIPFGTLLTDKVDVKSVSSKKNLPYLIKEFDISYAYSATLLLEDFFKKSSIRHNQHIAFSPSYEKFNSNDEDSLLLGRFRDAISPLEWTEIEAENIENYYPGKHLKSEEACESTFKNEAGQYQIIHLAMHALIDDQDPMNSKFIFAQANNTIDDGFLHTYEIYNMRLNADLAVLSACETGSGKLRKSEGIMSLARAFSYAGCPSVVMSHWKVNDGSTAKLMGFFYENLAKGMSKSQALRQAKLSFLKEADPIFQDPYFWGGFILIGDDSPITSTKNSDEKYFLISILSLFGFLTVFWFWKSRR